MGPGPPRLAGMEGWAAALAWNLTPDVATWRLRGPAGQLRYLKVARGGRRRDLEAERRRLRWAGGRVPVPAVLGRGAQGGAAWLLTAALRGADATATPLRADPARLVSVLARGLRRFHEALPTPSCPFAARVGPALRRAQRRVAAGLVAPGDLHADHGGIGPREALARAEALRPAGEDLVVCHGDYCLPNVLVAGGEVAGYIDLGRLRVRLIAGRPSAGLGPQGPGDRRQIVHASPPRALPIGPASGALCR